MQEHEKWLDIAKEHLAMAEFLFKKGFFGQSLDGIYHSCETSLKGYLAFRQQKVKKTRDLAKLLKLCVVLDKDFLLNRDAVEYIKPYF